MNEFVNKYRILLLILSIGLIITITSISYAYFVANVNGNNEVNETIITTGEMKITYIDGDIIGSTNNIIPGQSVEKRFKVKNTGTLPVEYTIFLSEVVNTFNPTSDLEYKLEKLSVNGYEKEYSEFPTAPTSINSNLITINANEEHEYKLIVRFKETSVNQDSNKGKSFSAKIQINDYDYASQTINVHTNGGVDYNISKNVGLAFGEEEQPTKDGYTFSGWYSDSSLTNAISYNTIVTANLTDIYVKWEKIVLDITYNAVGGTVNPSSSQIDWGTSLESLPTPIKDGYKFNGWFDAENDGNEITTSTVFTENKEIYAHWQINTYSITYNLNGGTNESNPVTSYNVTTNTFNLPTPTKNGYNFNGWYESTDFSGNNVTQVAKGSFGDKIYYAKWIANTYSVKLDKQDGSGGTSYVTATYASAMPSATAPSKSLCNFGGYYTSTGGSGTQYYNSSMGSTRNWDIASSSTLYAKWTYIGGSRYLYSDGWEAHYNSNGVMDACYWTGNTDTSGAGTHRNGTGIRCDGGARGVSALYMCQADKFDKNGNTKLYSPYYLCKNSFGMTYSVSPGEMKANAC